MVLFKYVLILKKGKKFNFTIMIENEIFIKKIAMFTDQKKQTYGIFYK
jgi:hypothetical protein